jgi:hypothetical protein
MISGYVQVVGFVLLVIGFLEIARAKGLVNKNSSFVTFRLKIGVFLLVLGAGILGLSLLL